MTDKTTLKDSTKIEDINVIAREAIVKTVNTMGTSANLVFLESIIFEATKGTQKTIYDILKEKKLKNWGSVKGAVSRACNSAIGAIALMNESGVEYKTEGTHEQRLKKIESVLKENKISMRKSYDKYKKMNAPEEEDTTEQQPAEQQPAEQQPAEQQPAEQQPAESISTPSESFNEQLILLCQKFEEDLSYMEMHKILNAQTIFYKSKLTKKQLEKLEKVA